MIQVFDNVYLDADDYCFMVVTWDGQVNKKNTLVNAKRKYYSELSGAVKGISKLMLRRQIADNTLESFDELVDAVNQVSGYLASIEYKFDEVRRERK